MPNEKTTTETTNASNVYYTISGGLKSTGNQSSLNVYFADSPESKDSSRWSRVGKMSKRVGGATVALFLGVGVPFAHSMNQQGDRIIAESLNPAQADFKEQFTNAKEDLKTEMRASVKDAGEKFQTDMEEHIDKQVEGFFAKLTGQAETPESTTTTTITSTPHQR